MGDTCPKCSQPLEAAQVDTYQVRLCRACKGVLLAHADLVAILESSWRVVTPKIAEEMEFHARDGWQNEPILHCPDCGQEMEKYGYMGLAAIEIDRCGECALMWLDADELQNMVLALAKDNYRSARTLTREREVSLDLTRGCVPPAARAGNMWLFPQRQAGAEEVAVVALQLLRLLL